jgi:hypothetical protein
MLPFLLHKSFISVAREKEYDDRHSEEWPLCEGIEPIVFSDGRASEPAVRTGRGPNPLQDLTAEVKSSHHPFAERLK